VLLHLDTMDVRPTSSSTRNNEPIPLTGAQRRRQEALYNPPIKDSNYYICGICNEVGHCTYLCPLFHKYEA